MLVLTNLSRAPFWITAKNYWRMWLCVSVKTLISDKWGWHNSFISSLYMPIHMMTSSNGNIFCVTGHLCGEFTGLRWIPRTKPVTPIFDICFDLHLNERLSKQSWGWWFETLSCPFWRQCNDLCENIYWLISWTRYCLWFANRLWQSKVGWNEYLARSVDNMK